ncbi:MAG: hypothetical protein EXR72_13595 [Myxococcales bacterium]|nr:hypothetical protein [Myxococcales bacterium]
MQRPHHLLPLALTVAVASCGAPSDSLGPDFDDPIWETGDGKEDTSATAAVKRIQWDGFVLVPVGASDATVQLHVRRQVKSAIGALHHGPKISLRDRDARSNLDVAGWKREKVQILAPDGATSGSAERVTYHYSDLALVAKATTSATLSLPLLFDDYVARAGELIPPCADDPKTAADSLWYHYDPARSTCQKAITDETTAINDAARKLPLGQAAIAKADAARRFLTVRASLARTTAVKVAYPELDRLWGFGTDRQKVVVYSFFGVDSDAGPRDNGLIEALRYVRTLRAAFPSLKVVDTRPFALLLDFQIDGIALPNPTYEDVARWTIDGQGWPAAVGSDPKKQAQLLAQVQGKLLERWIVWQLAVTVKRGAETRKMTVEIRTYYGREDGQPDWREAARNRYLEAFWHADIFSYTGHSHFGHGPLEPIGYNAGNFPDRYQTFFFNSCLSYNYYDIDFLEMHPGGERNLDVVANGLPAYWTGMGESTARYVLGLLDGQNRSWLDILKSMAVKANGSTAYDPLRAVTGEAQNAFTPVAGKIELTAP